MTNTYNGEDRRRYASIKPECGKPENCGHLDDIYARLERGADRMAEIEEMLKTNTDTINEMRDILVAAKGAFKVLGWLGVIFKWVGGIASALTAIYVLFYAMTHGGDLPK